MAKKPKNSPAAPNPDSQAKAPAAGPAPSAEETPRKHIEAGAKDRFGFFRNDLDELLKKDLKKADVLSAMVAVGEGILSLALQTKGRLRAAAGNSDAFLEMKAANIKSGLRKAGMVFDTWDKDMTAWESFLDIIKPVQESAARTVKDLDIPGMKAAITPTGPALFDDEGQPTEKAVAPPEPPAPAAEPQVDVPASDPDPAPIQGADPAAVTSPYVLQARVIPTLATKACPVIDMIPEPEPAHPLDGMDEGQAESAVNVLLDKLEEAGVEEGLKRKDWMNASTAWMKSWPEECDLAITKRMYDRVDFALNHRRPISWAVPTDQEFFDYQRKLAIAAGE